LSSFNLFKKEIVTDAFLKVIKKKTKQKRNTQPRKKL